MMKKNKLLKTFLLLTAMLVGSATNVWADPITIFDAAAGGWSASGVSLTTGTTTVGYATYYGGKDSAIDGGKTVDGITWGKRLKFGGGSTFQKKSDDSYNLARVLAIDIPSAGTIKVYFLSGKSGDSRSVYVSKAPSTTNRDTNTAIGSKADSGDGSVLDVTADGAGTYYVWSDNNIGVLGITFEATSTAAVTGYSLDGVKIDGTLATANTDYTLDNTSHVVTLTNSFITAPTVALVEKTTYETGDPTTKDVAVTLNKNTEGTYFEGTATIGKDDDAVEWTVKAPVNTTPTLEVTASAITVSSPKIAKGKATFTVTGANLTGESVTLAFASAIEGLTVSPETIEITDGAVEAEVTVSYLSAVDVAESNVKLTISTTGVDAIVIPVTYSSTAGITEIVSISEATTWDWSNTGISSNVESPNPDDLVVFSNIDGWASSFNASAITGKGQYLNYNSNKCFQGSILKFNTTVPGKVTVVYSNTGNRDDVAEHYRYLYINGVKADETGSISAGNTKRTVENYSVEAGDVVLTGIQGESTPNMLRIYSVVFTPATATVAVTGVTLDKTTAEVEVGKTVTLAATVAPENATNKNVTWESDNTKVATVDEDGVVTGVAEGTANITVTTEDGNKTATCVVTVKAAAPVETAAAPTLYLYQNGGNLKLDPADESHYFIDATKNGQIKLRIYAQPHTYVRVTSGDTTIPTAPTLNSGTVKDNTSSDEVAETSNVLTIENNAAAYAKVYYIRAIAWDADKNEASANEVLFTITGAVKVTATKEYSTFCSTSDLDFSNVEGLEANVVSSIGTSSAKTTKVNKVAAGTGLILKKTADVGTATDFSVPLASETDEIADNYMVGVTEDTNMEGVANVYILSDGKFYECTGGTLAAGKAYLNDKDGVWATTGAPSFSIITDDETTGINSVERGAWSVEGCYTLDGRRVEHPTKGLYIVNGKKVIIK